MQLYVTTKSKMFMTNEINKLLMMLQEDDKPKPTLQRVDIALLYSSLLRVVPYAEIGVSF